MPESRQRLVGLMVTKIGRLHTLAGYPPLDSTQSQYVRLEVESRMKAGTICDKDLRQIASTLTEGSTRVTETSTGVSKKSKSSQHSRHQMPEIGSAQRPLSRQTLTARSTTSTHQSGKDGWAEMALLDVEKYKQEQEWMKQKANDIKLRQRAALDAQVAERAQLKDKQLVEENRFAHLEAEQRRLWEQEAKNLEDGKKRKYQQEREIRDRQLRDHEQRKKQDEQLRKNEEAMIAQRIHDDLKLEKAAEATKRARQRADIAKFLDYNKRLKDLKASQALAEVEADRRHQQEYLRKLETQEKERTVALRRLYDRQTKQASQAFRLQLTLDQEAQKAQEKADMEQQRQYDKVVAEEEARKNKAKEERRKMQTYLTSQMQEKETERQMERAEHYRLREQLSQDIKEAEQKEAERRLMKKENEKKHRAELEEQIRARAALQPLVMTDIERRLNKTKLSPTTQQAAAKIN